MKKLGFIFLASFFFSIHLALLAYINSSMLGQYVPPGMISVIYTLSSALSLVLVFYAPSLIRRFGNVRTSLFVIGLCSVLLFLLGTTNIRGVVSPLFITYFSLNSLVLYMLDLYVEHYSLPSQTGRIRGMYLTITNIGWIGMPILAGTITSTFSFSTVYVLASIATLFVFFIILITQRKFADKVYDNHTGAKAFMLLHASKTLRRGISINFMLHFFYAWMVIYMPLYLTTTLGFDWKSVGIIFSIMLIPYVVLPYPIGKMISHYQNEKLFIITGFLITAIGTVGVMLLENPNLFLCALMLLITRIGIATVEVGSDSYFFKQVSDQDSSLISLYRNMLPFAYIIGPMTGVLLLMFISYSMLFGILACILVLASIYALRLRSVVS